jgi:hypothetical protein
MASRNASPRTRSCASGSPAAAASVVRVACTGLAHQRRVSGLVIGLEILRQHIGDLIRGHADLAHIVAEANGHVVVLRGVAVNRNTERCARFVLTAVPAANGASLVVEHVELFPQRGGELLGHLRLPILFGERP